MNLSIHPDLFPSLLAALTYAGTERGGILGGTADGTVLRFYADHPRCSAPDRYEPNTAELNDVLARWHEEGLVFLGMVHSHPASFPRLSYPDTLYAREILRANDQLEEIYFGVTQALAGRLRLLMFRMERCADGSCRLSKTPEILEIGA